jgi:hypothetical protein
MAAKRTRKETGEITAESSLRGEKLYQIRARAALPLLVRQATAGQTIVYSDLAAELQMPNPRNLNYVLGAIGNALVRLGKQWNVDIPPIQCLVINKNTGMPGEGVNWFLADREVFERSNKREQKRILQSVLTGVYHFPRWNEVLAEFGLSPVESIAPQTSSLSVSRQYGREGESEEHRRLKEFVALNPRVVGLPARAEPGRTEYVFPSADIIDVLFIRGRNWVGVEVKSKRSSNDDIARGLYQCVKYQALMDAVQKVEQRQSDARVVLLLEGRFPTELLALKHTLGVEVIDGVSVP